MKRCTKCNEEFPATLEYFHRNRSRPDGLHSYCKRCNNATAGAWNKQYPGWAAFKTREYQKNNRAIRVAMERLGRELVLGRPGEYRCPKCDEKKPRTEEYFARNLSLADGLNCWCRACCNAYARDRYHRSRNDVRASA